jgi:DNA mismatch repair protein MutS2
MRVTLPLAQLRPLQAVPGASAKTASKSAAASTGASEIAMRKAMQIAPELMLRALRAEEAQSMLDKYMDDAYSAGIHQVRIIHGKGTGALRKVVWEFLHNHPVVASCRLGEESEGGDGATVVTLVK